LRLRRRTPTFDGIARPLRIDIPGALHHVTARGNARQPIFLADFDRELFLATLRQTVKRHGWRCHAYCLMGNHYHLLIETVTATLSAGMRHLNGAYAQGFNLRHDRTGHLFQSRFAAILVEKERHLLSLCRYVVLNPVRAGLCTRPDAWRWSSYRASAGFDPAPDFLTTDWLLAQFGQRESAAAAGYRAFVADSPELAPWRDLKGQVYLGSDTFVRSHCGLSAPGREVPQAQRRPLRPPLGELLAGGRGTGIVTAAREHGYRLREIAEHLDVHPATVGRWLRSDAPDL